MKYILVTGGVISGVGKGVIASSFGTILKHCNIRVTSIKIDPYINIDAGTFSPYEHGERDVNFHTSLRRDRDHVSHMTYMKDGVSLVSTFEIDRYNFGIKFNFLCH